ncbi:TatD family hydrolase [Opitutus sp. ER46]|uniref:TatD family hydrolase n=1 Tax=Opitutus sp. ER46 TaxID=2161864 RepID=UPI000D302E4D|nr:TatD family hydrolase [Opitutus sp. ER46]PTX95797.1 TatD family deoxyribonuclease [Opitutus sp. ER46]
MALIDTHTHLESFARAGTMPGALQRAREAGVDQLITIGTGPDDWTMYREIAGQQPEFVRYTVGLHPCSVQADWAAAVAQIEAYWSEASQPKPVALGECGLDRFHLPKNDPAKAEEIFGWQQLAFAAQLEIAKRLGCVVVVHSRDAFRSSVEMIDASGVDWRRVVFHCFTEGEAEIAELNRRGAVGSFTGVLTYKSAENVRRAAKAQGLERFMIETDAPYLTPMPHRGKPNEVAYVRHTAEYAAQHVFGIPFDELARISSANARRFFMLP